MAKFVAISGPSLTGKSGLSDVLSTHRELRDAIFVSDIHNSVWSELVDRGIFSSYKEINKDSEYICVYIMRLAKYYNDLIKKYRDTDKIIVLDGCWLDLFVYASINLWYNRIIKSVQEEILVQVCEFDKEIDRIYITSHDDYISPNIKNRAEYKMSNLKLNRPLEIRYYEVFKHLDNAEALPSSDPSENSMFILKDLESLGYI